MNKLFIKKADEIRNINLDEVYFFTRIGNKTYAILKNTKIEVGSSLNYLSGILSENFLRSHKSFILNTYYIEVISKYSNKAYNVKFRDCRETAYITKENIKLLGEKYPFI